MNEVVKYHNDLNTVTMRRWSREEMNFFFAIISKTKEQGTLTVILNAEDLKELSNFADKHNKRWFEVMERTTEKVVQLYYKEKKNGEINIMTLFNRFSINLENQTITVEVSNQWEYILNEFQANFTVFELEEFTEIRSTYAKTMYRLLKQWRTQGKKVFSIKEFRANLDVPKSFKAGMVAKRILEPIKKELSPYFKGLKITPLKSNSRGTPIIGYEFTWQAEKTGEWKDFEKLKKNGKKKPVRTESVPEDILLVEKEDEEKKKKLQEDFFQKAMQLRNQSFEEQAELFSEAREVDTYRMPNPNQFLDTIASLMAFDLEKYWAQVVNHSLYEGESIG